MSAAITAAVVTVGATAYSIKKGRDARKASEASNEAQRQINKLRNAQAKRQFMRQFRQQYADVLTAGINQGIGVESSMIQGQRSSQISQGMTATREFQQMDDLGADMTASLNAQSRANFQAGVAGSIAGFAGQFIDYGKIKGIFSNGD